MRLAPTLLICLGLALIVVGSLGWLPTTAAGGACIGYAVGVMHARAVLHDALKRADGLPHP